MQTFTVSAFVYLYWLLTDEGCFIWQDKNTAVFLQVFWCLVLDTVVECAVAL